VMSLTFSGSDKTLLPALEHIFPTTTTSVRPSAHGGASEK